MSEKSLAAKFGEEATEAALQACRELREIIGERPDLGSVIIETLPSVVDAWIGYQLSLVELFQEPEQLQKLISEIPSIVLSIMSTIYGSKAGFPLSVLILVPASPLMKALGSCGRGKDKLVDPPSGLEAELRATIFQAQSLVYRMYFELHNILGEGLEEEERTLWKPHTARLLYI